MSGRRESRYGAGGWVERDAAVVWHGFTQMAAFPSNAPVIVDRAEGRELIDVEGNRYFDAISSLWVTTLGHRVPELDEALTAQLGRVAHATLLGNGSRATVEFAEALAAVVPVSDPHVLFGSDGAVAVEQALKVAFQYWVNRGEPGHDRFLALGDAYHGDTVGALSLGDGGFGTSIFDALRFPVLRSPGYATADWAAKLVASIEAHAPSLAAVVLEPLVQGASGMLVADPGDLSLVGEACRSLGVLLICDEVATGFGRTGRLFASEWAGPGFRPDLLCLGKGITGGYLPLSATVASGTVFEAFDGPDLGESTFYHGHSYGGNALACAVALRHLELLHEWRVLEHVEVVSAHLAERLGTAVAGAARGRGRAPARAHGGRRARPPCGLAALGPPGLCRRGATGRAAPSARRRRGRDAAAHHDRRGDRPRSRRPLSVHPVGRGRGRRLIGDGSGDPHRRTAPGRSSWSHWVEASCRTVEAEGRWRAPRTFDAHGPAGTLETGAARAPVVSFASNDYLGLTAHPAVVAAAHRALDRWGAGSGASRLVTGSRPVHAELEAALAEWKGCERAVVFPTGFAANLSVLSVFGGPGSRIYSDELNHASIVDGCRLARADVEVFPHGDLAALDARLGAAGDGRSSCPTRSSRWTATSPISGDWSSGAAGTTRCWSSTRPTPCSARTFPAARAARTDRSPPRCCASGPSPRRSARWAASSPGLPGSSSSSSTAPDRTSSPPHRHRPTPRRPLPRSTSSARTKAGPCVTGLPRTWRASPRRWASALTRRRSSPSCSAGRPRRWPRPASSPGAGCSCPRSDRRPSPPARLVCGSRSRRHTRLSRSTRSSTASTRSGSPCGGSRPRAGELRPGRRAVLRGGGAVRPERLVVVCGTATEVGKTWVSCMLLERLRARSLTVAARKPAQSFDLDAEGCRGGPTDAELLAGASGEDPRTVCPDGRSYGLAMAPPMAAEALGSAAFTVADLVAELAWPDEPVAVGIVETAGGVRSPQASDGDAVDLVEAIGPDRVLLVADAGLGTINAVRLSLGALGSLPAGRRPGEPVVVLDRFDPGHQLHARNRHWLAERDGDTVLAVPGDEEALADLVAGLPIRRGA